VKRSIMPHPRCPFSSGEEFRHIRLRRCSVAQQTTRSRTRALRICRRRGNIIALGNSGADRGKSQRTSGHIDERQRSLLALTTSTIGAQASSVDSEEISCRVNCKVRLSALQEIESDDRKQRQPADSWLCSVAGARFAPSWNDVSLPRERCAHVSRPTDCS
jgi:hypothetical protein